MNKSTFRYLGAGVVLIGGAAVIPLVNSLLGDRADAALPQTLSPAWTRIEQKIVATGTIVPRMEIKVKSHVNGVIDEVPVQPGQWVKQGEVIARVKPLADPVDINTTQKELNQAGLSLARAATEFKRQQQLHAEHLIADEAFRDVKLKYQLAQETLAAAKRSLELKLRGATDQTAGTSTQVLATAAGMVLEKPVEVGDFIVKSGDLSEGTTLVTVADMNHLIFKGDVQETDSGRLQLGMPLTITVGAMPDERLEAELEYIAPKARKNDQGRVTFEVRAAVKPKPGLFLRAGYSAVAEVIFDKREHVLAIPESYLFFRAETPYVKVEVAPGRVEERKITTGLSDGLNLEVVAGVSESDKLLGPEPVPAP